MGQAKDIPFHFDEACQEAFQKLRSLLSSAPIMKHPDWSLPFEIMCDAFDFVVGAVFEQRVGRLPHVITMLARLYWMLKSITQQRRKSC